MNAASRGRRRSQGFPGLTVSLREGALESGFRLAELVFAYPNRQGDIAELDIVGKPRNPETLPCGEEITARLQNLHGSNSGPLAVSGLPPSRPAAVATEFGPTGLDVVVPLAEDEPTPITYDLIGDGSEVARYTRDGRLIQLRLDLRALGSGFLVRRAVLPRYREIRRELVRAGIAVNGARPYLEELDPNARGSTRIGGRSYRHSVRGVAEILTDVEHSTPQLGFVDVHRDGRVLLRQRTDGALLCAKFYEIEQGVNLSGIPERENIERIFVHNRIRVVA